jgi:hypothetical protein
VKRETVNLDIGIVNIGELNKTTKVDISLSENNNPNNAVTLNTANSVNTVNTVNSSPKGKRIKKVFTINTNLSGTNTNNALSNTTTNAKGKQIYQEYIKNNTIKTENIKVKPIKKTPNMKSDISPKNKTTPIVFNYEKSETHKGSIISTNSNKGRKDYTTKLIKIELDKPNESGVDSYDRSKSQKQFKQKRKNVNNFLIPVVKTNLYDDDISLQQSFKSETYSSETDRESLRFKKLSDMRNEKKFSRQESTESKHSENEGLAKINEKLNFIKDNFSNKDVRVYCETEK